MFVYTVYQVCLILTSNVRIIHWTEINAYLVQYLNDYKKKSICTLRTTDGLICDMYYNFKTI